MTSKCPACNSPLQFETPLEINQQVICSNCGLKLDVVWLYPLELAEVIDYKVDPNRNKHLQKTGKSK